MDPRPARTFPASPFQRAHCRGVARSIGMADPETDAQVARLFGATLATLSVYEAGLFIAWLEARRDRLNRSKVAA